MFLYDAAYRWTAGRPEYAEATEAGRPFGQSRSLGVTYVSPRGAVFDSSDAPLLVHIRDTPAADLEPGAETVAEFDLDLPTGRLVFEGSGGDEPQEPLALAPGRWRARWSGVGEAEAELYEDDDTAPNDRPDRYMLELWTTATTRSLAVLRSRT